MKIRAETVWIANTEGLFRVTATVWKIAVAGMNVRHIYAIGMAMWMRHQR